MLNNPKVKFVKISRRHFDIITPKDNDTIYFIEENSGEITLNLGDTQITVGRFSNEELLELIEGKQESRPNGTDLLVIDGKINPLYIEYIENDIDSIKLKDIEQDNRLDIIESDLDTKADKAELNDYVTTTALDLQLLEKLNIRPNGTDLLVIDGKINSVYIDSLYVTDIETVNTEAEMLALPDMKRGDMAIVVDSETTYVLKQTPSNDINNWAKLLTKPEVISVNGKTGIVHIGISDIDGLQGILNSKLDVTTFISEVSRLEGLIDDKAAKEDVYTKTEVDTLLDTKANNENLASPDLTGKEYLGDGIYRVLDSNGITIDYDIFNGYFTINGTTTSSISIILGNINENETYTFKHTKISGSLIGDYQYNITSPTLVISYIIQTDTIKTETFTSLTQTLFRIYIVSGVELNNYTFKLQLEKGTTATPYTVPIEALKQHIENRLDTLDTLETSKQDKLVAGDNITIDENTNVISASGGGSDFYRVRIFNEQDKLITTQILYGGEKVLPLDKPGYLLYFGTINEFDYNDDVTGDIDLTLGEGIPPRYVQTTVEDFDVSGDYTGTAEYIILPADKTSGYKIVNPNVKGVATNGDYLTNTSNMFNGNNSLYLKLNYLNTSNVTNMNSMFRGSQATTLDLSSFDTSNVTDMGAMFWGSQATTLDLSSFDTSNVRNMGGMFQNSLATTLDLSSFDTSNVTSMSNMFWGSQATELDLSNFNTSNVWNMNNMFWGSQATTLDLSSFDTSNVTTMNSMFRGSQATTLDLSSFDTSKVTDMQNMFWGSQATIGYARTQTDADNFNNSSNKPSTLTFVVK